MQGASTDSLWPRGEPVHVAAIASRVVHHVMSADDLNLRIEIFVAGHERLLVDSLTSGWADLLQESDITWALFGFVVEDVDAAELMRGDGDFREGFQALRGT